MNRQASKRIKTSAGKSVSQAEGKALEIPLGNLVLLHDHPKGQNKIQDNQNIALFVMESKHQDPNVYIIKPLMSEALSLTLSNHEPGKNMDG